MADEEQVRGVPAELGNSGAVAPLSGTWRLADRPLLDRENDRRAIDGVLGLVRQGFSSALVLRGDHGVGKTTLLDYAIKAAAAFQVSAVVGAEPAIHFPFGAVNQLLIPFLPRIGDLPAPQRQAVTVAFGMDGQVHRRIRFSSGGRASPCCRAQPRPARYSARSTTRTGSMPNRPLVLGFVARRLYADQVGMSVALKQDGAPTAFVKLPTVEVSGLPDDAAAELLQSVAPAKLDPQLVERVLDDTGGNALALVELGSGFTMPGMNCALRNPCMTLWARTASQRLRAMNFAPPVKRPGRGARRPSSISPSGGPRRSSGGRGLD
jgi:hypothetical protein